MKLLLLLIATWTVLAAPPAAAHGGNYSGPPSGGANATSGAPTSPSGSASPTSASPSSAAGAPAAASQGSRSRGRTSSGRQTMLTFEARGRWEYWWEANKHEFLDLRRRLGMRASVTGGITDLTARGRTGGSAAPRPSEGVMLTQAVPLLREFLGSEQDRDILDSSVLALARMTPPDAASGVLADIVPLLGHHELSVATSATLSLGVLGHADAGPILAALMHNAPAGRRIHGGRDVPWLCRAFAALSLALLDQPDGVHTLIGVARSGAAEQRDLRVCAVVGLGLVNHHTDLVQATLLELAEDEGEDPVVRSYAPTSLGKLGATGSAPALLALLEDEDQPDILRRSCAIGLGRLIPDGGGQTMKRLLERADNDTDAMTRRFALMASARWARRAAGSKAASVVQQLADSLEHPEHRADRPWSALALGLALRGHRDLIERHATTLIDGYARANDPSVKAAFAVAAGLAGLRELAPRLHEDLLNDSDEGFRGYASIALGLLDHREASDTLRELCVRAGLPHTLRLQVATGLGLMADPQAVDVLVTTIQDSPTLGVSAAVAKALGLIGDDTARAALQELARNDNATRLSRAFACVGLGLVGERTALPWNAPVAMDNNYTALLPSIAEVLDIL